MKLKNKKYSSFNLINLRRISKNKGWGHPQADWGFKHPKGFKQDFAFWSYLYQGKIKIKKGGLKGKTFSFKITAEDLSHLKKRLEDFYIHRKTPIY